MSLAGLLKVVDVLRSGKGTNQIEAGRLEKGLERALKKEERFASHANECEWPVVANCRR